MQKITPCLWFANNAEEAVNFYTSILKNSKITNLTRYRGAAAAASNMPEGTALTITFEIEGQEFMALNGPPIFTFSPAVSFIVNCETQEEVDELWEKLSAGGTPEPCGWLKDKFGVSWQIVPRALGALLQDPDGVKAERVMKALLQMQKIDINRLKQAHAHG